MKYSRGKKHHWVMQIILMLWKNNFSTRILKNFILCIESIKLEEERIISLENIYIVLTILKKLSWMKNGKRKMLFICTEHIYIFREPRNELWMTMVAGRRENKKFLHVKGWKLIFPFFLPFFSLLMLSTVYSECVIFYLNFTICIQNSSIHSFDIKRKLTALG